jgi:hypothetical protein
MRKLIFLLCFASACTTTSRFANWDGTGTCYGEVVDIYFSEGSSCPKGKSTVVTTYRTIRLYDYSFTDDVTTFVICGHQDFISLGDKVWVIKNTPTVKDRHTHYAYIEGYKYAIE